MVTTFQQKVFNAVAQVPQGRVTTYKLVAEYLQCASPQAIGQALKKNPCSPDIPCHRVIASDLSLGGYKGKTGEANTKFKLEMLSREGVQFENNKLKDKNKIFSLVNQARGC